MLILRLYVVIGARSDAVEIRQCAAYHRRMSAFWATSHMGKCPKVAEPGRSSSRNAGFEPGGRWVELSALSRGPVTELGPLAHLR